MLFGGNGIGKYRSRLLYGAFQHYEYWNTRYFEVGTLGFGPGEEFRLPLTNHINYETSNHLNLIPFGASNSEYSIVGERNYNFSGAEAITEHNLNVYFLSLSAVYRFYWLHTYVGERGDNFLGIFIPRATIKIFDRFGFGAEYLYFHKDTHLKDYSNIKTRNSELRFYLSANLGYLR